MIKQSIFNDEEIIILDQLLDKSLEEKIKILETSAKEESDGSCKNIMEDLILKLKGNL